VKSATLLCQVVTPQPAARRSRHYVSLYIKTCCTNSTVRKARRSLMMTPQ
jgi:hypothetical protein